MCVPVAMSAVGVRIVVVALATTVAVTVTATAIACACQSRRHSSRSHRILRDYNNNVSMVQSRRKKICDL